MLSNSKEYITEVAEIKMLSNRKVYFIAVEITMQSNTKEYFIEVVEIRI